MWHAYALLILGGNALGARVVVRLPKAVFRRILVGALAIVALQLLAASLGA